ncbi:MAG: hypothetical protein KBC21_03145 [Candidatus Pacebacteria bacterium]|nr:hypothetical protein [Candidatus Paceibacterota bacterium]
MDQMMSERDLQSGKEARSLSIMETKITDYIMSEQEYIFSHFFGLDPNKEGISEEENDKIILYFYHAGIEVAKAYRAVKFSKYQEFNQRTRTTFKNEDEEMCAFIDDYLFHLFGHDVSHHGERVITRGESVVPTPLLPEAVNEVMSREGMKEELYAGIWMTQRGYAAPLSLAILQPDFKQRMKSEMAESNELQLFPSVGEDVLALLPSVHEDFSSYLKAYCAFILNIKVFPGIVARFFDSRVVYDTNDKALPGSLEKAHLEWRQFSRDLLRVSNDIESHPDKKLVELLRYVFENKNSPRVLVDLFFKELGPHIETLRRD